MRGVRRGVSLTALCCAVYFISYFARLNFSAVLADMIAGGFFTKSGGGLIGTCLFVTYGAGQILSGMSGDRFPPQRVILAGLALTALCNAAMPFARAVWLFALIWGVNGFAQALLWPPIVRLMSLYLDDEGYAKGCVRVTMSSQLATVFLYLAVPALITVWDWKSVFFLSAGLSAAIALVWWAGMRAFLKKARPAVRAEEAAPLREDQPFYKTFFATGLLFVILGTALMGLLRDGITAWLPTYFGEIFGLEASAAILMNGLLPAFSMAAIWLAGLLCRKVFRDECLGALFFFLAAALSCAGLVFVFDSKAILALLFSSLICGCMHAVNLMLVGYVPLRYKRFGKAATVSGIANAFVYAGSAASSFGFALIAESFGWGVLVCVWLAACLAGILCAAAARKQMRKLL